MNETLNKIVAAGLSIKVEDPLFIVGKEGDWQTGIALTALTNMQDLEDYISLHYVI